MLQPFLISLYFVYNTFPDKLQFKWVEGYVYRVYEIGVSDYLFDFTRWRLRLTPENRHIQHIKGANLINPW